MPNSEVWKECFRVLKPGGILLAFGHERTYHKLVTDIEKAGFDVNAQMMWIYGKGNKGGTKFTSMPNAIGSENYFKGLKTKVKGMHEPIAVLTKPLEGNYIENYTKYGTGAFFIDKCRIGEREPGNVMISEEVGEQLNRLGRQKKVNGKLGFGDFKNHTLELCNGIKSMQVEKDKLNAKSYNDNSGIERYFYVPKVSGKERGEYNIHPTVKPKELIKQLVKLVTPENGICCDPFFGSGSLGLSVKELGAYKFIGIEMEREYFDISLRRVEDIDKKLNLAA